MAGRSLAITMKFVEDNKEELEMKLKELNQKDVEEFETRDIYLASSLVSSGFGLNNLKSIGRGKFAFCFSSNDRLEIFLQSYKVDNIKLSPHILFSSFNDLKNSIFAKNEENSWA